MQETREAKTAPDVFGNSDETKGDNAPNGRVHFLYIAHKLMASRAL